MNAGAGEAERLALVGWLLVVWGVLLVGAVFLQPWASCEEEDSSAGCPVPPEAAPYMTTVLVAALVAVLAGVVVLRTSDRVGRL